MIIQNDTKRLTLLYRIETLRVQLTKRGSFAFWAYPLRVKVRMDVFRSLSLPRKKHT